MFGRQFMCSSAQEITFPDIDLLRWKMNQFPPPCDTINWMELNSVNTTHLKWHAFTKLFTAVSPEVRQAQAGFECENNWKFLFRKKRREEGEWKALRATLGAWNWILPWYDYVDCLRRKISPEREERRRAGLRHRAAKAPDTAERTKPWT